MPVAGSFGSTRPKTLMPVPAVRARRHFTAKGKVEASYL